MSNLHFILVNGNSAEDAAYSIETAIGDWGTETNQHTIGGIASEDGSDDIENHDDTAWPLSGLDTENVPKEGTYFSRAVAYLHTMFKEPVTLDYAPHGHYQDICSAITALTAVLSGFNPDTGNSNTLWLTGENLKHLAKVMDAQAAVRDGVEIPEFYSWQLDHEGLTDLSEQSAGSKRYILFLNMHS